MMAACHPLDVSHPQIPCRLLHEGQGQAHLIAILPDLGTASHFLGFKAARDSSRVSEPGLHALYHATLSVDRVYVVACSV